MGRQTNPRKNINISEDLYNELERTKELFMERKGLSRYPTVYFLSDLIREKKERLSSQVGTTPPGFEPQMLAVAAS